MNKKGNTNFLTRLAFALLLFAAILNACSPAPTPTATQAPEPTHTPSPTAVPTLASLPDGGLVYGDPDGRFSLPLVGEWTPVETDGSFAHFTLADPAIEMYVVTAESDDLEVGVNSALAQIGVDALTLSLLSSGREDRFPGWTLDVYSLDEEQLVGVLAQVLGGDTVAFIMTGESSVLSSASTSAEVVLTVHGFAGMPLDEYLAFSPPPPPSTVEEIQDLNYVEFYSGRTKLIGRLTLPDGEGPFPAIVYAGGGSGYTTRSQYNPYYMRAAGFAIFSYDKRGVADSEGVMVRVGIEIAEWRLPQLANDALAAVVFMQGLEEIKPDQVGLMGVSQNGWTIPLAAAKSDAIAFTVIIAGPTVSLGEEMYWSDITGDGGIISTSKREELSEPMAAYDGPRGFDPRPSIEAMSMPGLWLWGDLDGSIPARECKAILESIIEEYDKDFAIIYSPDVGHGISEKRSETVDWIYAHLGE